MPIITNSAAPVYRISSGLRYLPSIAPIKTDRAVTIIYAEIEPNHTDRGLPDLADIPIPANCVLSASSATNIAENVAKNIFQSINNQ